MSENPYLKIFRRLPSDPTERIPEKMRLLIGGGQYRFDVHTHIFNRDYTPNKFFEIRIPYLVNTDFLEYVDVIFMKLTDVPEGEDFLHYALFIDFATKHAMEDIAQYLINNSPKNTIFVVIALNLYQSIEGKVRKGYLKQLEDTAKIRDKYPELILPFFEVNPTNPEIDSIIEKAFQEYGFYGIKIYPSLGYLPSHPKLMYLYELCEEWNIPIIAHCATNNLHTTRNFIHLEYYSIDEQGKPVYRRKCFFLGISMLVFFNSPRNWEVVLKNFPRLRINFSHLGRDDDWDGKTQTDRNWSFRIFDFMERYENVYADVAYTFHLDTFVELLTTTLCRNKLLEKRLLFGTDLYMIMEKGKYKNLRSKFVLKVESEIMQKLSVENSIRFLGLKSLTKE